MKKFLLRLACFLLPVLFVVAGAEAWIRSQPNVYKYKETWIRANGQRLSTIVLGNSHAYYGLNPSAMGDSTFNLANVSQRYDQDFYLLRRYAPLCPHLRTVIMVADNSSLFDVPMEYDENWRLLYYHLYMGYDDPVHRAKYNYELANIASFRKKAIRLLGGHGLDCDSLGWGCEYTVQNRSSDALVSWQIKTHDLHDWTSTRNNVEMLRRIAWWCREHQLRLVLVMTPVSQSYTLQAQSWQLEFVSRVAKRCTVDFGAVVADYSCDDRFQDLDFFDLDHLSDQGARKLSRLLYQEWLSNGSYATSHFDHEYNATNP